MAINTKTVRDRRTLRLSSVQDLYAEVDRCVRAEQNGSLQQLGNWPLGTILGHLAFWASAPYEGYSFLKRPPALIRFFARLFRRRVLFGTLPAGMRLPGAAAGTFGVELISTSEGHARLRAAFDRLNSMPPTIENPLLGTLAHEEWIAFNLRHAEVHLSFLKY